MHHKQPTQYRLMVRNGPDRNRRLVSDEPLMRIGRGPGCDLRIEDPGVAPCHAEIVFADGRARLHVMDDAFPVQRNDAPVVENTLLDDGDILHFGEVEIQFHTLAPMVFHTERRKPWIQHAAMAGVTCMIAVQVVTLLVLWWLPNTARVPGPVVDAPDEGGIEALTNQLAMARERLESLEADRTTQSEEELWDGQQSARLSREIAKMRGKIEDLGVQLAATQPADASSPDGPATNETVSASLEAERAARDARRREQEAGLLITRARRAIADNQLMDADRYLVEVQQLAPDNVGSYMTRARLFERRDRLADAVSQWDEVLSRVAGTEVYEEANAERTRLVRAIRQQELDERTRRAAARPPPREPEPAPPPEPERGSIQVREPKPPSPIEPAPASMARRVKIGEIRRKKFPDPDHEKYEEIRLVEIPLSARKSLGPIQPRDLEVTVNFFEKETDTGRLVASVVRTPKKPLELQEAWNPAADVVLTALYMVSRESFTEDGRQYKDSRRFYGYVVRVYYQGRLEDEAAFPSSLLAR